MNTCKLVLLLIASMVSLPGWAQDQNHADKPLADKTMVVWVALADLDQQGGSALTIDDGSGHFDGIVFGEKTKRRWMAGSDSFLRTPGSQEVFPEETASPNTFFQIAIVYSGSNVSCYRNGKLYSTHAIGSRQLFGPGSTVLFGRRHIEMQGDGYFRGRISDARIYDRALTPEEISVLVPNRLTGPAPWAWWSFSTGSLQDQTGRFTDVRITGEISLADGCLVLGGQRATMTATRVRTPSQWAALPADQPVPGTVLRSTREFRERLLADPYRPAYHFCLPEDNGMPGDPNGAFFYQGRYHLMYLYNREGSGFSWGHVSSHDLLHWRHHPDAIGPGNGDEGCFSGGAYVTPEGKAYLTYWQLWGAKGIGMAESRDDGFDNWSKFTENPVIGSTEWGITERTKTGAAGDKERQIFGSADPSNIWIKDGKYYMLTGNLLVLNKYGRNEDSPPAMQGDRTYLFVSEDLKKWEYLHPFYESTRVWTDASEDNMCPSFLPLPSGPEGGSFSGKHLMLFISHNKGCQYYTGTYSNDRFLPEKHGRMTWIDNGYFAPEALLDGSGRQIMWAWIFDDRPDSLKRYTGWTGTYGLPRTLWLGDDGTLRMRPVKELENLRINLHEQTDLLVAAGSEVNLDHLGTELMELELVLDCGQASRVGIQVCRSDDGREQTTISYDAVAGQLRFDTGSSSLAYGRKVEESAPFRLEADESLTLRIFVDRSVVEVYANDRQAIARSVYPTLGGTGIRIFAKGDEIRVRSVRRWEMAPSNSY